jgi:hypothetical protein
MNVRAKMAIEAVDSQNDTTTRKVVLMSRYSDNKEDNTYSKFTPYAKFELQVDNPPVIEFFEKNVGKQVYVDMVLVEEAKLTENV